MGRRWWRMERGNWRKSSLGGDSLDNNRPSSRQKQPSRAANVVDPKKVFVQAFEHLLPIGPTQAKPVQIPMVKTGKLSNVLWRRIVVSKESGESSLRLFVIKINCSA